jgi:hypothetical protein
MCVHTHTVHTHTHKGEGDSIVYRIQWESQSVTLGLAKLRPAVGKGVSESFVRLGRKAWNKG